MYASNSIPSTPQTTIATPYSTTSFATTPSPQPSSGLNLPTNPPLAFVSLPPNLAHINARPTCSSPTTPTGGCSPEFTPLHSPQCSARLSPQRPCVNAPPPQLARHHALGLTGRPLSELPNLNSFAKHSSTPQQSSFPTGRTEPLLSQPSSNEQEPDEQGNQLTNNRLTNLKNKEDPIENSENDHALEPKKPNRSLKPISKTVSTVLTLIGTITNQTRKKLTPILVALEKLGHLPIHTAVQLDKSKLIEQLCLIGQDANAMNEHLETPLMLAAKLHRPHLMTVLVEKLDCQVNLVNLQGYSPLFYACGLNALETPFKKQPDELLNAFNQLDSVRYLLSKGADPNLQDNHGMTLLHHLASVPKQSEQITSLSPLQQKQLSEQSVKLIELILAHGGDISMRDNDGHTPLHRAAAGGDPAIIQTLLAAGGDIFLLDRDYTCQTPRELALQNRRPEVAIVLTEAIQKKLPSIADINQLQTPTSHTCFHQPPAPKRAINQSEAVHRLQKEQRRHFFSEWIKVIVAFEIGLHWQQIGSSAGSMAGQVSKLGTMFDQLVG